MATIKIKGRTDPIRIPNDRARKLKERWLGDPSKQVDKAQRTDIIDLGDWCGEYGQIASIELDKAPALPPENISIQEQQEAEREREMIRKLPPEKKADMLEKFKVTYSMRHNFQQPNGEVLEKARQIQLEYFRAHPDEVLVPNEAFGDLLPTRKGSLADKMKI